MRWCTCVSVSLTLTFSPRSTWTMTADRTSDHGSPFNPTCVTMCELTMFASAIKSSCLCRCRWAASNVRLALDNSCGESRLEDLYTLETILDQGASSFHDQGQLQHHRPQDRPMSTTHCPGLALRLRLRFRFR